MQTKLMLPTSSDCTFASESTQKHFACYLATKSGSLSSYQLRICPNELQIVTVSSHKVKSTIPLDYLHIKEAQKQPRPSTCSENDTSAESAQ